MKEILAQIYQTIHLVYPNWIYFILLVVCVLTLAIRRKDKQESFLGFLTIALLAIFLCPAAAWVLFKFMRHGTVYWRFLWIVPTTVVIAYTVVELTAIPKRRILQVCVGLLCAIGLLYGGRIVYKGQYVYMEAPSREKLSPIVLTAANVINENAAATGNSYKRVIGPQHFRCQIRQLDATILSSVGRSLNQANFTTDSPIGYYMLVLEGSIPDVRHQIYRLMKYYEANYLVIPTKDDISSFLENSRYTHLLYRQDGWDIWYSETITNTKHANDY